MTESNNIRTIVVEPVEPNKYFKTLEEAVQTCKERGFIPVNLEDLYVSHNGEQHLKPSFYLENQIPVRKGLTLVGTVPRLKGFIVPEGKYFAFYEENRSFEFGK